MTSVPLLIQISKWAKNHRVTFHYYTGEVPPREEICGAIAGAYLPPPQGWLGFGL